MVNLAGSLSRPGATLRYADLGEGRPIVLTHGAGVDHEMYASQITALTAAGHRVIAWDLRGHGLSSLSPDTRFTASESLDDLEAIVDALRLERPVLVGHSLGGNLSQAVVRRSPERFGGLVVIDATWNTGPLGPGARIALRLAAPSLALIPQAQLPGLMARASALTPTAVAYARDRFAAMPKKRFLDVWRATVSLVTPNPDYRTPVTLTLVRGDRDRTGNIATAMPRWADFEEIGEHVVPNAGHIVTMDAADAVCDVLLRALAAS